MKKILVAFFVVIASLSGFSQSFSVDNESLSVPRYANQTAITAAIPSPTVGMLVYNNALNQYAYWNGSAWTNLSAGASGPVLWSANAASTLIQANGGYPNGIEVLRLSTQGSSSLENPLFNSLGANSVFFRYGAPGSTAAIFQESTTGLSFGTSGINWRYADNASPQGITNMFGYGSNTFSITGALSATGNATIGGTNTTTGASNLRGKLTVGTTTTSGNGLEIQSSTTTSNSPDIYIKSPNNVIRYGGVSGNAGMMQSVINSATPTSASMSFVHLDNAATPVQTMMMTLDGEGDLTAFGFTKLGGSAADVPAVKTKILTGNMPNAATITLAVPHGLTASKIIEARVMITGFNNTTVSDNYTPTVINGGTTFGYLFNTNVDASSVNIVRNTSTTSSSNGIVTAGGITATYKIYITYIP